MKYVQARNYTRVSDYAPRSIEVIVVHTMEYPERPDGAEWCANYFAKEGAPKASCHYAVDADSVVQCVKDRDVAWAAPGNNHNGIQIEHAGYAAQGKPGWRDSYSQRMLQRSAVLAAQLCRKHNIPVRWLSPADLKAGRRGLTSHANVSLAWRRSNHTDPGRDFPVGQYLLMVKNSLPQPTPRAPAPLDVVEDLLRTSNDYKRGNRKVVEALKRLRAWRKDRKV